jgi:hypothetical protein
VSSALAVSFVTAQSSAMQRPPESGEPRIQLQMDIENRGLMIGTRGQKKAA